MSRGKYSPNCPNKPNGYVFYFNAKGELPPHYDPAVDTYNEELHFGNYDEDGFDSYGYSAYDNNGNFVRPGRGVDRNGYTEMDYLEMTDEEFYYL